MQKKNLVATCMIIPSGIIFAIGMVLALLPEWNMVTAGIVIGAIGLLGLILVFPVYRKVGHYPPLKKDARTIGSIIIGTLGALLLGVGMCFVMVPENPVAWQIILGMAVGVVGLVAVILNPIINLAQKKNS